MKKVVSQVVCFMLVCMSTSAFSVTKEPYETVLSYLNASQSGDVDTIKSLIDGPYLRRSRNLLENNKNYPAFLIDYYTGATFLIADFSILPIASLKEAHPDYYRRIVERYGKLEIEIDTMNDQLVQIVRSEVTFANGNTLPISFLLKKDKTGIWKIVEKSLFK